MEFRIADTFTDSLSKLNGDEQKAVKTTAFDMQMNPANPGLSFHKLDRAKDKNFWSIRVNRDIRIIVHKTESSLLLCYVDHHDKAYQWAERRKLETHPKTGAAQLVEVRELVREISVPQYITEKIPVQVASKPLLFDGLSDDELLGYGVPEEWLGDVHHANEDNVLELADHLPAEASEALLELATGGTPQSVVPSSKGFDPFEHPDAQRRFRIMKNVEELERALNYPWEKWTIFLHPAQREWVEKDYNGPARVSGSAGTGKTIVALHRAVHLARANPEARVLLTTFSEILANSLRIKLSRLISNEPRMGERLEVHAIDEIARRLYEMEFGAAELASAEMIRAFLEDASTVESTSFNLRFLETEWHDVVDAWQLESWESYRDIRRLGRKRRLAEKQRASLWAVFEQVRQRLYQEKLLTWPALFSRLSVRLAERVNPPFDFTVVDEAQDIGVAQLKFLATLGGRQPNGLFFAGDLGQRIFQTPFSWKSLGVDIRGRSRTLHVNYRTSHQIRMQADRLLGPEVSDVDGNTEERRGTVSLFNGPQPTIEVLDSVDDECDLVSHWLLEQSKEGLLPREIGVFVRSASELERAKQAVTQAGLAYNILDQHLELTSDTVSISTMHLAKGLEYRAVVVMACDDEVIPSQQRIETVVDESDLEEVYNTERHLLYVACTRARDNLLVTGVDPSSEYLDDLLL